MMSNALKRIASALAVLAFAAIAGGCALIPERPIDITYLTVDDAKKLVDQLVTSNTPGRKLAPFYQNIAKYESWIGTWNCNRQLVRVSVERLLVHKQEGNRFEAENTYDGDPQCMDISRNKVAGKFDNRFAYFHKTGAGITTWVAKYEFRNTDGALVYRGLWRIEDGKLTFAPAGENPRYYITNRKNPESGGPSDMWSQTELLPTNYDPNTRSAMDVFRATLQAANASLGQYASEIAGRQSVRDANEREANAAARTQALAQLQQNVYASPSRTGTPSAGLPLANLQPVSPPGKVASAQAGVIQGSATGKNAAPQPPARRDATTTAGKPVLNDTVSGVRETATAKRDLSSSSNAARTDMAAKTAKKEIEWEDPKPEAIAICLQSTVNKKWKCRGSLDNQILFESSLEEALGRQHCSGGTWAAGGPVIDGEQWQAYRCGKTLGAGDYDVTKRYPVTVARRMYHCQKGQLGDGRCTTPYNN